MRSTLILLCIVFFGYSQSNAQDVCDNFQPGFVTAEIFIPSTASLLFNGQPLPIGGIIIPVDQDGNCCAEPVIWMEQDINITINGQAGGIVGYQNAELLAFLVSKGDSCFTMVNNALFDNDEAAFFNSDQLFTLSSFQAVQEFSISGVNVENTKCDSLIGEISLDIIGGTEPIEYMWAHDPLLDNGLADGLMEGTYGYTITDDNGCSIIDSSVVINAFSFPDFDFQIDTVLSMCDTIVVSNVEDCNNCTYLWNDSLTTEPRLFMEEGLFTVEISNGECMGMDTVEIALGSRLDISAMASETQVCIGDTIMLSASGGVTYEWASNADVINVMDSMAEAVIRDTSFIRVIGMDDCYADTVLLTVNLFVPPSVVDSLCGAIGNNAIQLNATGAEEYLWEDNPVGPVSQNDIPDPTASPSESTNYYVNFVDENGCQSRDSVYVEMLDNIEDLIPLYNIITPNGDGRNDLLIFDKLETVTQNELKIYNRWGKVVYEVSMYANDWGGLVDGEPLPAGTYYYVLNVNGSIFKSNLTLVYE